MKSHHEIMSAKEARMVKVSWFKDDFSIVFHSYRSNFSDARKLGIALMRRGWQVTIELDDKEVLLSA